MNTKKNSNNSKNKVTPNIERRTQVTINRNDAIQTIHAPVIGLKQNKYHIARMEWKLN